MVVNFEVDMTGITRRVANKDQLKSALLDKADVIVITNEQLARNVRLAKHAKKGVAIAVMAGAGVAAANWWNPVGWAGAGAVGLSTATYAIASGGAVGLSTGATVVSVTGIIALAGLGTLFMVMYNDYEMEGKAGASAGMKSNAGAGEGCLLYTSPSPRDRQKSRMPSSA